MPKINKAVEQETTAKSYPLTPPERIIELMKNKHKTGLMVLLGLVAGAGLTIVILSGQGTDAGIAFPFYFPIISIPFIVIFIAFERYYYTSRGGITTRQVQIGIAILAVLALIAVDIAQHR